MKRHPKGDTVGGQFAARSRDESGIILVGDQTAVEISPTTVLSSASAMAVARLFAREHGSRNDVPQQYDEDIAQDALLSLLISLKNEGITGLTSGLISSAVRNSIATAWGKKTGTRHEDWSGLQEFERERDLQEAELGRELNLDERDELADTIRMAWPNPKHRPRTGFHQPNPIFVSLSDERIAGQVGSIAAKIYDAETAERPEFLLDRFTGGEISRAEAQRLAWNELADDWDVPEASHASVSKAGARRARRWIANHPGGVAEISRRYLQNGIVTGASGAMFSPFSGPSAGASAISRRRICEAFVSHAALADRMWLSASIYAERAEADERHLALV